MSELRDAIASVVEGWWGRPDPRPTLADAILEALRATLAERPELIEELGWELVTSGLAHSFRPPPRSADQEPSE